MVIFSILFLLQAVQTNSPAEISEDADECVVLAKVAREHLGFDQNSSPPLRASGGYLPDCPWEKLGVLIGTVATNRQAKLVFSRPRIRGDEATVDSLLIKGPLSGARWECRLGRGETSWELRTCRRKQAI